MTSRLPLNMAISATVLDARFQSLPLRRLSQRDQPLRLRILQRPQQDGVDNAEERGGGANPEREGEDGGQREGMAPPLGTGRQPIACGEGPSSKGLDDILTWCKED